MSIYTSYLFAQPSFMEGCGRVLDLGGVMDHYNYSESGQDADARALWADWLSVAESMKNAMSQRIEELKKQSAGKTSV